MQWKSKSKPAVWFFIIMLVVQLLAPFRANAADSGADGLILTFEASKSVVAAGEEFSYIINYSASSTVSNFTDPKIKFTLPEGVTYTGKTDNGNTTSSVEDSVAFPDRKEVTFAFKDGVLPAGSAGKLVVRGKFENYVTPDGTTATANSSYEAFVDGSPVVVESNDVTVTATADAKWTLAKKKIRPVPEPFKGADVQYEIMFRDTAAGSYGNLNLKNIVITDKLPEGAVFVSADNGGTLGPDNTVFWNLEDDLRDSKRLTLIVNYPDSMTATEVTNQAEAHFTPIGKPESSVSAQVSHGFETTPMDMGSPISKGTNSGQREISPGQTVKFYLNGVANNSNMSLTSGVIEDMTPTHTMGGTPINFDLQTVKTAVFAGIDAYDVYYTLVENPTDSDWNLWQQVSASTPTSLNATALGSVKGVQFRLGTLPINFVQNEPFELTYKVPVDFVLPPDSAETVKNNVKLNYVFNGVGKSATSYSTVDIVSDRPLLKLEKTSSKSSLIPTEVTTYTLKVTNDTYSSSAQLENPVIVDQLPAELEYLPDTWKVTKPAGIVDDPTFTAVPQADGTTKLTWSWADAAAANLQIGKTVTITFDAKVKAGTQQQSIANRFQVLSSKYLNDTKFSNKKCPACIPSDGVYSLQQVVDVLVNEDVALQSEMFVKGELDTEWSKYPNSGVTAPGGSSLYQLKIRNVGNVATNKLTIVNTFARIGDRAVLNGSVGRGSQWGPLLTGPVVVPSYVKAYYSTTPGVTMNATTGTDNGLWAEHPPEDLTSVTAVKFVFDDDFVINPLDSMTFEWPMVAPVGAPTGGEIAWNSYGYKMNKANGGSVLPSEPLKIGIKIQASAKAEIGDFVWLDQNENGIQDASESGVNGVKVELYNEAGTKLAETLTGNDFGGNPGYFLFPNLDPGKYSLTFRPSATYEGATLAGRGSDRGLDSDADPATGSTALITLGDGEKNHSVDAGLVLKKAVLGDYVWLDVNDNGQQDPGEAGKNGLKVELYNGVGQLLSSTTTAANNGKDGYYEFRKLEPGTYQVKVSLPSGAYRFAKENQGSDTSLDSDIDLNTGKSNLINLAQGEENMTVDAGIVLLPVGSVGDFVWVDANRNGIQDLTETGLNQVKVQLYNDQNVLLAQTVTADHAGKPGYYAFDNLTTGNYYVKFVVPYAITTKHAGILTDKDSDANAQGQTDVFTLLPGQNLDTIDAGVVIPDAGSNPPASPKGSIGDRVWIDANANGVQDADETGRNGISVELYNAKNELVSSVVTADRDGKAGSYLFDQLEPGNYQVRFRLPAGLWFTGLHQGKSLALDSDADPFTGRTSVIALGIGENNATVDAGLLLTEPTAARGQIGDFVWLDLHANGIQDADEPGLNGVSVQLYDKAGHLVSTAKTSGDSGKPGSYLFSDLPEGEYRLKFTAPEGYKFTSVAASGDGLLDSNADAEGWTKVIHLGAGESNLTVDAGVVKTDEATLPIPVPTPVDNPKTPDPVNEQTPAVPAKQTGHQLLPQTGEREPILPWVGWAVVLLAGSLLLLRRYTKSS
ncbi:DUF11 domain-containing protein [Tumebacillus sp. ITR2]|uniref:DUF11 domain-containing protein n=1 Tax=Tumebacillus amylolyticus TaxID=2801339 RepID=A0ABS1JFP5_9BACL|nr:SdrD B-like domain-containing protein [Tumebacillus amylolyticus]MBL0389084.1 DUF11 domain-containing protein [Tumebacillus amylolyticus]